MIESGEGLLGKLSGQPLYKCAWGRSKETPSLFYDLASLTKVIVTNSLLLEHLIESKKTLEEFKSLTLGTYIRTAPAEIKDLKLGDCWDHRASLKAHILLDPLKSRSTYAGSRTEMWAYVLTEISKNRNSTQGETLYSDLDYWVLGALLESYYKKNLNELWQDYKKKYSLPLNDLMFGPLRDHVVPTETRHAVGIVNDDNACFLQGIAPHAGLFSTSEAVWDWMLHMQSIYDEQESVRDYFIPQSGSGRFWCGWDRPSEGKTQAGEGASRDHVIGHLGFTGTALWWDPLTKLGGLLLTNRVYPSHSDASRHEIQGLRNKFFSVLWQNNKDDIWNAFLQEIDTYSSLQ